MDDSGHRNRIRSVTEPSTPLRKNPRIDESFIFHSQRQRTIFRTSDIHLPPHELPSITAKLSQESNSAPGSLRKSRRRSRSRPTTPLIGRDSLSGLLSDTTTTPTRNTDRRRSSSNFTMGNRKRKRRSLIITEDGGTAFDPNYIGPITIDYLRLFCKVAIEEQTMKESTKSDIEDAEPSIKSQETIPAMEPEIADQNRRKSPIFNDFDQSLPLPEVESIPVSPDPNDIRPLYDPVDVGTPPQKKKKFSYLERILASQAKKNQKTDRETIRDSETIVREHARDNTNRQVIDSSSIQTHLVIEDNSAYIRNDPSEELNIHPSAEPEYNTPEKINGNLFVPEDSSDIDEQPLFNEQLLDHEQQLDHEQPLDHEKLLHHEQPLDNEQHNNDFSNINEDNETNDIMNISGLPKPNDLLESISTPTENLSEFQNLFNQDEEEERESLASPNGVIHEEYTIDNDFSNDLFEGAIDRDNENNDFDDSPVFQPDARTHITRIIKSDKTRTERNNIKLPINMIKNVVKTLQVAPLKSNSVTTAKQIKHSQKPKRLSPDIYEFIQQKSDDFILNVVADLEAYSKHRTNNKGNQINIKDVLLYLNRIKFSTGDQNRTEDVDNIANLAYEFLPLELLISLDNNLHGSTNTQKPKIYEMENQSDSFASDSESEYVNEIVPQRTNITQDRKHLQRFSDSETE